MDHLLFDRHGERLGHVVVEFSPLRGSNLNNATIILTQGAGDIGNTSAHCGSAYCLRHREDPLPQRQVRQVVIGEMRRRRHPAPGVARWAHAPGLAGERDQEVVAALPAPRADKAVGEMLHSK